VKLYVFVHSHLSSAQKAVQAVHVAVEFMRRHHNNRDAVTKWARFEQTVILVEGGNSQQLSLLGQTAVHPMQRVFPAEVFYEDADTLNSMMTAVAVLVPDIDDYSGVYELNQKERLVHEACAGASLVRV